VILVFLGGLVVWAATDDRMNQSRGIRRFLLVGYEKFWIVVMEEVGSLKKSEWNHVFEEMDL
jgi:hypothetical protein